MINRAVSQECQVMEERLSAMLARIERRDHNAPAAAEDGAINHKMLEGLRTAQRVTQSFMAATRAGCSLDYRGARLNDMAQGMKGPLDVIKTLQTDPAFSPFFSRMMDREYYEWHDLLAKMRDAVYADGALLNTEAQEPAPEREPPAPLVWAFALVMMPAVLTMAAVSGFTQCLRGETPVRHDDERPRRHLTLVHNQ